MKKQATKTEPERDEKPKRVTKVTKAVPYARLFRLALRDCAEFAHKKFWGLAPDAWPAGPMTTDAQMPDGTRLRVTVERVP